MILSGSKDSTLKVWDVRTRKLKTDLPGHADEVYSVDWSTGRSNARVPSMNMLSGSSFTEGRRTDC